MKKKLQDYKYDGNGQWEALRAEFSRDMDELGKVFSDSIANNPI